MRTGARGEIVKLKALVGSGEKVVLFTLPFLAVGLVLDRTFPSVLDAGSSSGVLTAISIVMLVSGVVIWIWSVVLILTKVPKHELITYGPFSLVKHPLYTSVALLVLPGLGLLLDTWLGVLVGLAMYVGSRIYSREEEETLSETFGDAWDCYCNTVKMPWL